MNLASQVTLALSPVATSSVYAVTTEATPTQYALVALVLTVIISPFLIWMMKNQDKYRIEAAKLATRREERIDKQIEIQGKANTELEKICRILASLEDKIEQTVCKYVHPPKFPNKPRF